MKRTTTFACVMAVGVQAFFCLQPAGAVIAENNDNTQMSSQACARDITCWARENQPVYAEECRKSVEKTAEHAFLWSGDRHEPEFTAADWLNYDESTITVKGDNFKTLVDIGKFSDANGRVAFQHGQGTYKEMHFECDFDPAKKLVTSVRVSPVR